MSLGVNWTAWWVLIGLALVASLLTFRRPGTARNIAHVTAWVALVGAILLPVVMILRGTPQ